MQPALPVPPAMPSSPVHPVVPPHLEVTFDSRAGKVSFFMVQVAEFLWQCGGTFLDETSKVSNLASRLEGSTANWYISLYETGVPEFSTKFREGAEGTV